MADNVKPNMLPVDQQNFSATDQSADAKANGPKLNARPSPNPGKGAYPVTKQNPNPIPPGHWQK